MYSGLVVVAESSQCRVLLNARLNAAEMFVDVSREGDGTSTNWVAESGVLDLFLLLGPTPRQVSTVPCVH